MSASASMYACVYMSMCMEGGEGWGGGGGEGSEGCWNSHNHRDIETFNNDHAQQQHDTYGVTIMLRMW